MFHGLNRPLGVGEFPSPCRAGLGSLPLYPAQPLPVDVGRFARGDPAYRRETSGCDSVRNGIARLRNGRASGNTNPDPHGQLQRTVRDIAGTARHPGKPHLNRGHTKTWSVIPDPHSSVHVPGEGAVHDATWPGSERKGHPDARDLRSRLPCGEAGVAGSGRTCSSTRIDPVDPAVVAMGRPLVRPACPAHPLSGK